MLLVDATALNRLNAKLVDYYQVRLGKITVPEIVEKKGTDLRLQAWKLLYENKWGGKGRRKQGIAFAELKRRAKAGKGTFIRQDGGELQGRWGAPPSVTNGRKRKGQQLTRWQKLVWQETTRRQSGLGVLAVSLLSKKYRRGFKNPTPWKEQKTSKGETPVLSQVELAINLNGASYTIEGFTPHMADLANKHNVGNRAIAEVMKDMDVYLNRKFAEAKQRAFGGN